MFQAEAIEVRGFVAASDATAGSVQGIRNDNRRDVLQNYLATFFPVEGVGQEIWRGSPVFRSASVFPHLIVGAAIALTIMFSAAAGDSAKTIHNKLQRAKEPNIS